MNNFLIRHYRSVFTVLLIALLVLAFFMGFLTGKQQSVPAVELSCTPDVLSALSMPVARLSGRVITKESTQITSGAFVGSKNGTKYYPPECAAVKRIKPENYVWFRDAAEAELQGYTKAASC